MTSEHSVTAIRKECRKKCSSLPFSTVFKAATLSKAAPPRDVVDGAVVRPPSSGFAHLRVWLTANTVDNVNWVSENRTCTCVCMCVSGERGMNE